MNKKLQIKVCGMKYLFNRRELENLPVDWFGFIFYRPSPRYAGGLPENDLRELTSTSAKKTAVFVDAPLSEVFAVAARYGFSHVQLHGRENPEYCRQVRAAGLKVIKVFRLHPDFRFEETEVFAGVADFFLFDTKTEQWGGSGQKFNWQILENYKLTVPFFLRGGIGPGDAEALLNFSHPVLYGIDLNSGFEDFPGMKDHEKLKKFLERMVKTQLVTIQT